jgi:rRNA maturation RNase YbeY
MIDFNYETNFKLKQPKTWSDWLGEVINEENREEGELNYIFCDDAYLHELNVKYLNHDTLTDIITFDYTVRKRLHGDIYISVERILENAKEYDVTFEKELARVMVHGVLHLCGYKDKSSADIIMMRAKEDHYISQLSEIEM